MIHSSLGARNRLTTRLLVAALAVLVVVAGLAIGGSRASATAPSFLPGSVDAITFGDATHGWVVGPVSNGRAIVAATRDGGATWNPIVTPLSATSLADVASSGPTHAWAVGEGPDPATRGEIFATTDGVNWVAQSVPAGSGRIADVTFVDPLHGWAVADPNYTSSAPAAILRTVDGGATWTSTAPPSGMIPTDLSFIDQSTGWAVGSGSIARTTDGGASWTPQTEPAGVGALNGVTFLNATTGWAVGDGPQFGVGGAIYTTNGGSTWTAGTLPPVQSSYTLTAVSFADASHGWAVGGGVGKGGPAPGARAFIFHTTDGGATWTRQDGSSLYQASVVATSATTAFVGGGGDCNNASILKTTDSGATWVETLDQRARQVSTFSDVSFPNSTTGWAVGSSNCGQGAILGTVDGGSNWSSEVLPQGVSDVTSVTFPDSTHGWALATGDSTYANSQLILATSNGGLSWTEQSLPAEALSGLSDITFVDATHGWAVGGGVVIATTDGGVTWSSQAVPDANASLAGVKFINTSVGFVVGSPPNANPNPPAVIWTTTNGGALWTAQSVPTSVTHLNAVDFTDASNGWAAGSNGSYGSAIVRTINGGATWTTTTVPANQGPLSDISMAGSTTGWAVGSPQIFGDPPLLLKTTDGSTWTQQGVPATNSYQPRLVAIAAASPTRAWTVGGTGSGYNSEGRIVSTTDGTTWLDQPYSYAYVTPAAAPVAGLDTARVEFSQPVGTTSGQSVVTLTNAGSAPLAISGITTSAPFAVTNPTCPASLAVGASCTTGVTFRPTGTGSVTGTLTFADNAGDAPQRVLLVGTGTGAAPVGYLSPANVDFGNPTYGGAAVTRTVNLTNTGNAPLTISGKSIVYYSGGPTSSDYSETDNCPVGPATLAPTASCSFTISFRPYQQGQVHAQLDVTDDSSGTPGSIQSARLSGTSTTNGPVASVYPSQLTFASQLNNTSSSAQTVTVYSQGTAPVTGITVSTSAPFTQANNCPASLAVGTSCQVSVTFHPTATGPASGTLTITDNAAFSPQTVALSGQGSATGPALQVTPSSLTFGPQQAGTTSPSQDLTLTNVGTVAVQFNGFSNYAPITATYGSPACTSTIAPGASCKISVAYAPSAGGPAGTSTVDLNNSADGTHQVPISYGQATVAGPLASLTPNSAQFGTQPVGTTSPSQVVTLTNTGNAAMSITGTTTSPEFNQTNNCGSTLAAGASCKYTLTMTPASQGYRSGSLSITDSAPGSPHTVNLSGTGSATGPAASVDTTSLDFGNQAVGTTSAARDVTLANTGTGPMNISNIQAGQDFGQTNNCGTTLAAGARCVIHVTFQPSGVGGTYAQLTVTDDANGSPQTVDLRGNGTTTPVTGPAAGLNPSSLTFPGQVVNTTSAPQSVTLTNGGNAPLAISSIATTGDYGQSNNCGTAVAAGANCTINVTFTPTTTGARTGTLSVTDNAGGSPHTASLSGTGTSAPAPGAQLSPTSLSFPDQAVGNPSVSKPATLTNNGNAPLSITSISTTGDYGQANNCGASVAAGASCTINVTFTPTTTGARPGALSVTDNASGSPHTAALSGNGVPVARGAQLSPTSLAFSGQQVGTVSSPQAVTVTNNGNAPTTISNIAVSGDYTQANDCGAPVAAGAHCTIRVSFAPTTTGTRTGTLTVTDNASGSPQTVGLTGTGNAVPPPPPPNPTRGYNILNQGGGIYSFGDAGYHGNLIDHHFPGPGVSLAETPDGNGYAILTGGGGVYTFGNAGYYGNLIDHHYPGTAVAMAYTPSGHGYSILTGSGALYSFGDAAYHGNLIDHGYPGPAVGFSFTPTGGGYNILTAGGAIYSFGDAAYFGNLIDHQYPGRAVSISESKTGNGYAILTSAGNLYTFGDQPYYGNLNDHGYPGPATSFSNTP